MMEKLKALVKTIRKLVNLRIRLQLKVAWRPWKLRRYLIGRINRTVRTTPLSIHSPDWGIVETGAVKAAIAHAAEDATLILAGASERGLLTRLSSGSPLPGLVDVVNCSILLAERPSGRGLLDRLVGG